MSRTRKWHELHFTEYRKV